MTLKNLYIKETCERQCITQIWNHSSICTFGFVNVNVHNKNMISFWRWMKTGPTHSCQNRLRRESNCSLHSTISATPPVLSPHSPLPHHHRNNWSKHTSFTDSYQFCWIGSICLDSVWNEAKCLIPWKTFVFLRKQFWVLVVSFEPQDALNLCGGSNVC